MPKNVNDKDVKFTTVYKYTKVQVLESEYQGSECPRESTPNQARKCPKSKSFDTVQSQDMYLESLTIA